jgi:hypothetical protein
VSLLRYRAVFFICAAGLSAACTSNPQVRPPTVVATATPVAVATATPAATATPTSAPTGTPTPTPTGTPTAMPSAATVSLNGGAALTNQPLMMAAPAPAGYAQNVQFQIVSAAAKTTVSETSGTTLPSGLAPLASRRGSSAVRTFASTNSAVLYDSIVPSANITVSGNLSYTASFPSGGLSASTSYYLGYYDSTQASPAWQTISGPVTPSGNNVTFSGTVSSITLVANKLYGFAVFSTTTPSASPPPAPQTYLYFGNSSTLTIASTSGTVVNTLAIPSQSFDIDDAANVYAFDFNHGGTSPGVGGTPLLAKFPAGSATPSATYAPSIGGRLFVSASGAGEVAAIHNNTSSGNLTTDVWDPGVTGSPSRTYVTKDPSGAVSFAMTHDGTLYLPDLSSAGVPQYDVYPPGATTTSRIILETIVPASQYNNFAPNYTAVGADGTLYVTEYSYQQPDPNAGLYIYPPNGPEKFIATPSNASGAGPQGVAVDASGNIYVVNNNAAVLTSTTCQNDTLQSVTVYNSSGTLLRTINSGFTTAYPITTAADGTSFFSTFKIQLQSACAVSGANAIYSIAAGASMATQISSSGSTEIVLFDGTHKTEPFSKSYSSGAASSGRGGSFMTRRRGGF